MMKMVWGEVLVAKKIYDEIFGRYFGGLQEQSVLLARVHRHLQDPIERTIQGEWKMVESFHVDEFLEKRGTGFDDRMVFVGARQHFELENGHLRMSHFGKAGKFETLSTNLNEQYEVDGVRRITFVIDNCLCTFSLNGPLELERRYVLDGRLYIITNRSGVCCSRIYEKLSDEKLTDPELISDRTPRGSTSSGSGKRNKKKSRR